MEMALSKEKLKLKNASYSSDVCFKLKFRKMNTCAFPHV